jgi:hypothetical protein
MLDKEQITKLFEHLGTPRAGRELVLRARTLVPVSGQAQRADSPTKNCAGGLGLAGGLRGFR